MAKKDTGKKPKKNASQKKNEAKSAPKKPASAKDPGKSAPVRKGRGGLVAGIIAFVVVIIAVAGAFFALKGGMIGTPGATGPTLEFQKGMGYVTWSKGSYLNKTSDESLAELPVLGCDHVSILVTWYQTNAWSGDIHRTGKTPSDESLVHAIRKAKEDGMKIMLKAHLDLIDKSDGSWRGEIACLREEEWDDWFKKYTEYILYYAAIAEEEGVEIMCIGTELSTTATAKGYMWETLIARVREVYSGQLVYAAHWDRYLDIRFWGQLDYVGINAYFPLTEEMEPSYEDLDAAWSKWVAEIEEFHARVQKPIIFPEAGCNSADGAAIRPWEHVPRTEVNVSLQADYYKALLNNFWDKEWFYGLYWWYWGTNPSMGGKYNRGFTPQNKPAEDVIKEWYAKPANR